MKLKTKYKLHKMAKQISAQPDKKTISDLIGKIKRDELILQPEFQRDFVWTPSHMENFVQNPAAKKFNSCTNNKPTNKKQNKIVPVWSKRCKNSQHSTSINRTNRPIQESSVLNFSCCNGNERHLNAPAQETINKK